MLGDRLLQEPYHWDYCITSSLSRAAETGKIVAAKLGIPLLEPDDRIRERAYGQVEGMTAEAREAKWGKDWKLLSLGQESDEALQVRGLRSWRILRPGSRVRMSWSSPMEDSLHSSTPHSTKTNIRNGSAISHSRFWRRTSRNGILYCTTVPVIFYKNSINPTLRVIFLRQKE